MVTVRIGNEAIIRMLAHRDAQGEYWHLEHGHARGAHLDNGHEEVNTGQGSTDTGELQRPNPVINPYAEDCTQFPTAADRPANRSARTHQRPETG